MASPLTFHLKTLIVKSILSLIIRIWVSNIETLIDKYHPKNFFVPIKNLKVFLYHIKVEMNQPKALIWLT